MLSSFYLGQTYVAGIGVFSFGQTAMPDADLNTAWTPTPGSPTTLFDKVADLENDTTYITSPAAV